MVKPALRRQVVVYLQSAYHMRQRQSCRLVGLHRNTARYRPKPTGKDDMLIARIKELAEQYPRYGYPTLYGMLKAELLAQNHKRIYRIYRELELNLKIKPRRRRKRNRPDPLDVPRQVNQVWSIDFMHDRLSDGRGFRTFNVLDDYNREGLGIEVNLGLPALRIIRMLEQIIEWRSKPKFIRSDNVKKFRPNLTQC